jgi:hypothetical protein
MSFRKEQYPLHSNSTFYDDGRIHDINQLRNNNISIYMNMKDTFDFDTQILFFILFLI